MPWNHANRRSGSIRMHFSTYRVPDAPPATIAAVFLHAAMREAVLVIRVVLVAKTQAVGEPQRPRRAPL